MRLRIILAAAALLLLGGAAEAQIRIDDQAARAVLAALGNPRLAKAEAQAIAHLPGNRALVLKLVELGDAATEEGFAAALVAAARGDDEPTSYGFARVKKDRATTLKLMDYIDAHPEEFVDWIGKRIAPFTPPGAPINITGYMISGGQADGFTFDAPGDSPDFYMNISRFGDEAGSARVIMAHELYHGVQHLVAQRAGAGRSFDFNRAAYVALGSDLARDCYATRAYFRSLLAEGTATLVGDPALLPEQGAYADSERRRRRGANGKLDQQRTLFDMSLKAITSPTPTDEESVYAVGFYGAAPMYDLGFAMAKAIVASDGDAAIGRLISEPPENFVRRYIALTTLNSKLPPLGPIAVHWATRAECPN